MAWPAGQRVEVCGLVKRPELNGARGSIISFDEVSGRHVVSLDAAQQPTSLKPENVSLAPPLGAGARVVPVLQSNDPVVYTLQIASSESELQEALLDAECSMCKRPAVSSHERSLKHGNDYATLREPDVENVLPRPPSISAGDAES
eukprot:CAMPEP_0119347806 /NCGR_PEP_ID=MMETSP1333-20130426/108717_1 /TAXON_ID=418940 /ORGANISM="Scyphosphaera apsteinii, Strain RCC1455" /LENGTH=145 /DNA_ID=CAMNT_0007360367 /DNA_START=391 /DNA_END=828 /DNA_ORIENTATION=-